jgi:hypothetical protein
MRALVIHDEEGRIQGVVTRPDDTPPAHPKGRPGELFTETDLPDIPFDPTQPESVAELLQKACGISG